LNYFKKGYIIIDLITKDKRNFQVATKNIPPEIDKNSIFYDLLG
jgi:hypothetical protein